MWQKETTQIIKWQDNSPVSSCKFDSITGITTCPPATTYDIKLTDNTLCTSKVCPTFAARPVFTIARSVSNSSYSWGVGKITGNYDGLASNGSYTIQICQTGTNTCDSSDSPFKITSENSINSSPKIVTSSTQPGNIQPGQSVNFSWTGTDPDNDDLSWSVDWGENIGLCYLGPAR